MDISKPITFEITPPGRFRRQTLRYDGSSVELNSYRLQGRVLNLSLTGVAIETPNRILVGGEYSLRLTCGELETDVIARVQWCRMKGTRGASNGDVHPIFHAGLAVVRHHDGNFDALVAKIRSSDSDDAADPLQIPEDEPTAAAPSAA